LFDLPLFPEEPDLCIPTILDHYLCVTRELRGNGRKLIITTVPPHNPASTTTINRWIKATLKEAGIEPEYLGHSTRHAATSAARKRGVDLAVIRETANWSARSQTFARHYYRNVRSEGFAATVLGKEKQD